ncbi:hypothetical protein [Burkholderia sp. BCC1977]|uniref:hypothetical protein n=1 Tax=Burkholderia sp. BCC1977 TaxID=2817440 RepID=UPI002ABE405E|nr:hypothetical protein [Burkholderia sp. BCC1977]
MIFVEVEIATVSGKSDVCEIEYTDGVPVSVTFRNGTFGVLTFREGSLFDAITSYRRVIEPKGYFLLCNGARKDAYPSRMMLQMGLGKKIYLLRESEQARREDLVDIFGGAAIDQVCSVDEQRSAYESWLRSLK